MSQLLIRASSECTYIEEGASQHENDSGGSENGGCKYECLVEHIQPGDVIINSDGSLPGEEQVENISHSRGSPPSSLVKELVETLRSVGQGVSSGDVFYPITL